jgi:hypothetical protein
MIGAVSSLMASHRLASDGNGIVEFDLMYAIVVLEGRNDVIHPGRWEDRARYDDR